MASPGAARSEPELRDDCVWVGGGFLDEMEGIMRGRRSNVLTCLLPSSSLFSFHSVAAWSQCFRSRDALSFAMNDERKFEILKFNIVESEFFRNIRNE